MDGLDLEFPVIDLETPVDDNAEVVETPVDDNAEVVTPPEGESSDSEATEEEQEPSDGRRVPDDVRKALKALRDSSPENAKAARALNDVYGREQAYKAIYPTVKDAQTAQSTIQTIESFGGLDAIQQSLSDIEEVDQLLSAGDPKAIDKIFEVSGEGFSKIAPAMLDKLQASNPEAYAAAIRPHLVTAIGQSGLSEAFGAVIQAYQFAQTPGGSPEFKAKWEKDAVEGLTKIQQYLQSLGKTPPGDTKQPVQQNDAFTKREQELAAKEARAFNSEVGTLANSKMNVSLQKALTPYLRNELKNVGKDGRADVVNGIYDEVKKLALADKEYQRQKDALFKGKTKDAARIAQHMATKFDAVVADAAKTVVARRYGKTAPAGTPGKSAAPAAGGTGSPILIKELPARTDVDWNKTTDDMMIRGIRVLKNGRTVKLDR